MLSKSQTIVIKIGTLSLVNEVTREPLLSQMAMIVETAVKLRRAGHRIVLVSSGAIAVGMKCVGLTSKPSSLSHKQALAAIGQGRLIARYDDLFRQFDQEIAQVLLTRNDITDYSQFRNAQNTIEALLDMGVVPIVNENDTLSVLEIKFGDNDTLSAITAVLAHALFLFLLTDVDCLYTSNPRDNPDAKPILRVTQMEQLAQVNTASGGSDVGTGGMTTKLIAAEIGMESGVTTVIMRSSNPLNILPIVEYIEKTLDEEGLLLLEQQLESLSINNVPLHTRFSMPLPELYAGPVTGRQFWLLHGLKPKGLLVLDVGAYKAIIPPKRHGLLPVGIIGVVGTFHELECVELLLGYKDEHGKWDQSQRAAPFGRARVNYKSVEIELIMGHQSSDIEKILGYSDSEYVAHRSNMAFPPAETEENPSMMGYVDSNWRRDGTPVGLRSASRERGRDFLPSPSGPSVVPDESVERGRRK